MRKSQYDTLAEKKLDQEEVWYSKGLRQFVYIPPDKWPQEWHIEPEPGKKWIKPLMSDRWIQIDEDTPRCCDPSSELYWSM